MRTRPIQTLLVLGWWVVASLIAVDAYAQCPPLCGGDPKVPNHFTMPNGSVRPGETTTLRLELEAYQPINWFQLRFEMDPNVAEFVGVVRGDDIGIVGHGGSWHLDIRPWHRAVNDKPKNPGWQLNYVRIANWGLPDICAISDPIWGSLWEFRNRDIRQTKHVVDFIVRGNAPGTTEIWVDRTCQTNWGGPASTVVFHPEGQCLNSSARACIQEPGASPVQLASFSTGPWVPPAIAGKVVALNPVVTVEGPTAVEAVTWEMVKRLYH
jgi:hypothetical protein